MSSFMTNRGVYLLAAYAFRGATIPANFYVALITSGTTPTVDTNTMADVTEIAAGNGYTSGGFQLSRNSTDFDVLSEDDTGDLGSLQIKDIVWTASGGSIPASGNGARYAVLTDDNGTVGSREVYMWWDLTSDRSVSDGQTLTLQNCEMRLT